MNGLVKGVLFQSAFSLILRIFVEPPWLSEAKDPKAPISNPNPIESIKGEGVRNHAG